MLGMQVLLTADIPTAEFSVAAVLGLIAIFSIHMGPATLPCIDV